MTHSLCPHCKADWNVLRQSLKQVDENYDLARYIILNCKTCYHELGRFLEPTVMTIEQYK